MKKTGYSVTLKHLVNGEPANKGAHGDEAEAIVAMARAHQDIHWDGDDHFLIPWSAVLGVTITKSIEDVSAPHDDICDGYCAKKGPNIKLKDGVTTCISTYTDPETGDTAVTYNFTKDGETVSASGDTSAVYMEAADAVKFFDYALDCEESELTDKIWLHPNPGEDWMIFVGIGDASDIEYEIDYAEEAVLTINTRLCE